MLAIGVVILVTIDVLILGVYSIVDRNNLDAVSVVNRERTQDEKGVCSWLFCRMFGVWIGVVIEKLHLWNKDSLCTKDNKKMDHLVYLCY